MKDESASRSDDDPALAALRELVRLKDLADKNADWPNLQGNINERDEYRRCKPLAWAAARKALEAPRSELTRSVAVKDMEIIGHREPGDAHKGRAWWSGGTWLQPGEVVAVLTLPKQDER